ncbi:SLAC1 anion channel family protein [Arhodomonas sp. SL1]|uniref:SLAC1 anion channel family protein n=1 Tax=Arhodomonas sp. SL1 TaxID=3425691 RepID=UPI003F880F1D
MATRDNPTADSRLRHFPVSMFSVVMGMAGLTLAWQSAAHAAGLPMLVADTLRPLVAALFLVIVVLYAAKLVRYPASVIGELRHPVKLSFFPTISISLILLGTLALPALSRLALVLWATGSLAHLVFTLYVMNSWLHHEHFEIQHMNPAWFIPAVGNILIPIAGVPLGLVEVSWFFFSIGLLFWIVLMTIVVYRMIFHQPLPARLMPTLFILVAPPAVGFLSYLRLTGGEPDGFARILFHAGLFLVLLLLTQYRRFTRLQFFLSWWAYSFPLAAMTVAAFTMYASVGTAWLAVIAGALLVLVTGVVAVLVGRTVVAVARHEICVEEG